MAIDALSGAPAELVLQTLLTPSPVCNQAPREGLEQHRETQALSVVACAAMWVCINVRLFCFHYFFILVSYLPTYLFLHLSTHNVCVCA